MTEKLTRLVQRSTTGYTLLWSIGGMLLGALVFPHASINVGVSFFLLGLAGLLGLAPRYIAPARKSLGRGINAASNLSNLAAVALLALQLLGIVFYHY